MGWLAATPQAESERGKSGAVNRWDETREQFEIRANGGLPLIDHPAGDEWIELLLEIEPYRFTEMGERRPLDLADLFYFQQMVGGLDIAHQEPKFLLRLSSAYLQGMKSGENPLSIMPIERETYLGHFGARLQKRLFASSPFYY